MRKPLLPLARAGGVAVCTCALAASTVAVPEGVAPRLTPATVQLAALPTPLTATVPDIIGQSNRFAALIDPIVTQRAAPPPLAAAAPGMSTSAGTQIANGVALTAGFVIRAVVTVLQPLVNAPVIGPAVGGVIVLAVFGGGLAVAAVVTAILRIEQAVDAFFGFVGSALRQIFRLPAALLGTLTGAAGAVATAAPPAPALRTAIAPTVGEHTAADLATPVREPAEPQSTPTPTSDKQEEPSPPTPGDSAPTGEDVVSEPTTPTAHTEPTAPATPATPDTAEPPASAAPAADETTAEPKSPAPTSPRPRIRHPHAPAQRDPEPAAQERANAAATPNPGHRTGRVAVPRQTETQTTSADDASASDTAEG